MARNRKNQPGGIRLGPAVKVFVLCMFFGGSGVGYVWQKTQIHELGKKLKVAELALDRWRAENHRLAMQWNSLRSPSILEARIKELNLDLAQPAPQQILRLTEPDTPRAATKGTGPLAREGAEQVYAR